MGIIIGQGRDCGMSGGREGIRNSLLFTNGLRFFS